MSKKNKMKNFYWDDEAPTHKQFLMVIVVLALLIASCWVAYHWYHLP
jgi:hypothetical protein